MNSEAPAILFQADYEEVLSKRRPERRWLRMRPFGVQVASDGQRPILLLKNKTGDLTLPVALSPLEAGVTLSQNNQNLAPSTPHKVAQALLEQLHWRFTRALFTGIQGPHQYLTLVLHGSPQLKTLRVRADEAMSFCLQMQTPIFATKTFIERSKVWSVDNDVRSRELAAHPEVMKKDHPYMM